MITMTLSFPSTDELQLQAFESQIGCELPEEYREFLRTYNGGQPECRIFDIVAQHDTDRLRYFYGIQVGDAHRDLAAAYCCYQHRLPDNYLPIGCDAFGNQLCIGLQSDDRGNIFFWDHELEHTRQLFHLADSFNAFIRSLRMHID